MDHPYANLPATAFWKTAVANRDMLEITGLWQPKFEINSKTRIATFGSCFAQHFGRHLREKDYAWVDAEPAPEMLDAKDKKRFNYGLFSARTGNIYTTSLLRQWVSWAVGDVVPPDEIIEQDGRFYDPFRPTIEPNGFESADEVLKSRNTAINSLRTAIETAGVFVFTLGLTESWINVEGGYEYPLCPGTVCGEFDEDSHQFNGQNYASVEQNLLEAIAMMRQVNKSIFFLLTVSPVPLTATYSGKHVLLATSASKAILRAAAESMCSEFDYVDYFPSFEIISNPVFKGAFFEQNLRSVSEDGVGFVMQSFFSSLGITTPEDVKKTVSLDEKAQQKLDDLVCEEELLAAFGPSGESK